MTALAVPFGAAVAWLQVWVAVGLGVLEFDRRFDAGADDDWLVNLRYLALLCASAVVIAALLAQVWRGRETAVRSRVMTGLAAAAGACTVLPYVMTLAAEARAVHLVDERPVPSAVQAVLTGVSVGLVIALLLGLRGASARGVLSGVLIGSGVWWAGTLAGAVTSGWSYDTRQLFPLVLAVLGPAVAAVLAAVATRRHAPVTVWLAGLVTAVEVVGVLLLIRLIGPQPVSSNPLELLAALLGLAAATAVLVVRQALHRYPVST